MFSSSSRKIPGSLVALVVMTIAVYLLKEFGGITGIETIGDRFVINSQLPEIEQIPISLASIRILFPAAFTIAMLGAIESLLAATVADGVTGKKHNSNVELAAQGIANIITPFFGGIPATGAIARTMTNINNGGRTPVAGIIHAAVLLLVVLFLGDLTRHIPMACLAGVLVVVAYNMSEWRMFLSLSKQSKDTRAVLLTTFLLTVIFDLTIAIGFGLILAVFTFLKRMNQTTQVSRTSGSINMTKEMESRSGHMQEEVLHLPPGVEVYEIEGPFFFGVANKFDEVMRDLHGHSHIRIIRMRRVPFIDSTGLNNLEALCSNSKKEKIQIILAGVKDSVREKIERSEIPGIIGKENICDNIHRAVERAIILDAEWKKEYRP